MSTAIDRLKRLDNAYAAIEDKEEIILLPVGGRYEVEITESEITEQAPWGLSNNLLWKVTFKNADGQRTEYLDMERESTLFKVRNTAKKLGHTGTLSELATWAPVAVGAKALIDVVERPAKNDPEKKYVNVDVVRLLAEGKGRPAAPAEPKSPSLGDDFGDIPFAVTGMDSFL